MLAESRIENAIWQSNVPATPSTSGWGTQLTAHATPHSKGTYTTLVAATTYDWYGFWLGVHGTGGSATRTDMMLDIAIGASQENIIIPEWLCGWRGGLSASPMYTFFPIYIPRGTQISGRIQALITVDTAQVQIVGNAGTQGYRNGTLFSGCDAYGTAVATSIGTSHTPGNAGAESTDANLGSTLSKHYGAVILNVQGTLAVTTQTAIAYHWELTIGGTTIAEWMYVGATTETVSGPYPPTPFMTSLPSGTQLQVQAEASGTAQAYDVAAYCFY